MKLLAVALVFLSGLGLACSISMIWKCTAPEMIEQLPEDCLDEYAAALLHLSTARVNFTEAEFDSLCLSGCMGAIVDETRECYGEEDELTIGMIHVSRLCDLDEGGVRCFVQYGAVERVLRGVRDDCLMVDGGLPDTCMENCTSALQNSNSQLGCCANTGNITGLNKPELDGSLWESCGVETPGFCVPAAAGPLVHYSVLFSFLAALLATTLTG